MRENSIGCSACQESPLLGKKVVGGTIASLFLLCAMIFVASCSQSTRETARRSTESLDRLASNMTDARVIGLTGQYFSDSEDKVISFEAPPHWVTNAFASALLDSTRVEAVPWEVSYELEIRFDSIGPKSVTVYRYLDSDAHAFRLSTDYYQSESLQDVLLRLLEKKEAVHNH